MNSKSFVTVLLVTFMIGAMMVEIAEAGCDSNGCCNCSRYIYSRHNVIILRNRVIRMILLCIKQAGLHYIFQAIKWRVCCSWYWCLWRHQPMYVYRVVWNVLWNVRWEVSVGIICKFKTFLPNISLLIEFFQWIWIRIDCLFFILFQFDS